MQRQIRGFLTAASFMLSSLAAQQALAGELTISRTYSTTTVDVPKGCETDGFKQTCSRIINMYARRFEREMVLYRSSQAMSQDDDDRLSLADSAQMFDARQHIKMNIYLSTAEDPVFALFSVIKQRLPPDGRTSVIVESLSFDSATGAPLRFNMLFKKPELAAMLCARAIEKHYASFSSPLLPVVIAATELEPSNYLLTAKGLRFFFAPGLVNPASAAADSMLVPLSDLQRAEPVADWWKGKKTEITEEDLEAAKRHGLDGIIALDSLKGDPIAGASSENSSQASPTRQGKRKDP